MSSSNINTIGIDNWSVIIPMLGPEDQSRLACISKEHYLFVEAAITHDPDEGIEMRYRAYKLSYLMASDFRAFLEIKKPKDYPACRVQITQAISECGLTRDQLRTIEQAKKSFSLFPLYRTLRIAPDKTPPPQKKTDSPLPSPLPNPDLIREIRSFSTVHSLDICKEIGSYDSFSFFNRRRGSFTQMHRLVKAVSKTVKPCVQLELGHSRLLQRRSPPSSAAPSPRHGASN